MCLTTNRVLRVTSHLKCRRHEYRYDHWNWKLKNSEIVQDYGFSDDYSYLSTVVSLGAPYTNVTSLSFEKKSLILIERLRRRLLSMSFGGSSSVAKVYPSPPERIYHDNLLHEMCEQLKDDDNDDESSS